MASRVRRLAPTVGNPERFHEDKSELAHDMADLAQRVCPSGRTRNGERVKIDLSPRRIGPHGQIVAAGSVVVKGKRLIVRARRMPFAISIG